MDNGLYYRNRGTWTKDQKAAFNFNDLFGATHCCVSEHLSPVYYVLKFEDPKYDIRLPCCAQNGEQTKSGESTHKEHYTNTSALPIVSI